MPLLSDIVKKVTLKNTVKIWVLILPLILMSTRCDNTSYQIPYARIELHLNIISELGNPLNDSYTVIDGGVNGLIIYRESYNVFHAYDRTCTLYPDHNEQVMPDENFDGVFTCPECESQYLLSTGASPISGSANFSLHEYACSVEGDILHVYN